MWPAIRGTPSRRAAPSPGRSAMRRCCWTCSVDLTSETRCAWTPDLGFAAVEAHVAAIAEQAAHAFTDLGCDLDAAHPGFGDTSGLAEQFGAAMYAVMLGPRLPDWEDRMDPVL